MPRVSRIEDWVRPPARPHLGRGECVVIRSSENGAVSGLSDVASAAPASRLRLSMIPPGTRGIPHFHADRESALYTVSGETEIWHGDGLSHRTVMRAGDFMYVPPGTPHLAANRSDVMTISVVASTDPEKRESVVVVELPRHLAGLLSLPVSAASTP